MFVAYYFVGHKQHLHDSCRDAGHNRIARNVIDNDCAGCDHGTSTDGQTGYDDGSVPDPNVIFDDRCSDPPSRIPNCLPNDIHAMIITPDECYVPADQDLITDRDVTLDITSGSELDEVSQGYSPVRRPESNAHGTAHEFSADDPCSRKYTVLVLRKSV
jgi:hypothetical protein